MQNSKKDNFARTIYAGKIADKISDHYQDQKDGKESENMVFAISGKWGEGKTKLLDLLEPNLITKGFTVIRFNPWQYSQEDVSLKRSFLRIVKEKLGCKDNLDDLYFDQSKTVIDWKPILKTVFKVALISGFVIYVFIPLTLGGNNIFEWWGNINSILKNFWSSGIGGVIFTALIIPLLIKTIVVSSRKAQVTTAEEFDIKFKELLKGKEKIVIFVDDLDRCTSSTVKLVLDSLRTFFHHPECSYVITGDHTVIERYAAEELNPKKDKLTAKDMEEGRRFLKKLFDVYWRLPLATPKLFGEFISDEIKKSEIAFTLKQEKIIKQFLLDDRLFERNPRHAKRFITALKFALQSVDLQSQELNANNNSSEEDADIKEQKIAIKEILDNVDLLAKVLLFQEKFYPIYEKLVLYPADIVNHEKTLRRGDDSSTLTIDGKNILKEILENDLESLKDYAKLVTTEPQFTSSADATILDPTNFFSFSAATGLPSLKGPDETNFPQYLKSGQLTEALGASLENSPSEKRTRFAQRAVQIFDEATDIERPNIVGEGLKMAVRLDEWTDQLEMWKTKLFSLPPESQNNLSSDWWKAVLIKSPNLLKVTKTEKPAYFKSIWPILKEIDKSTLHKDSVSEFEKILKEDVSLRPPLLLGVEIFMEKFNSKNLANDINAQLIDPAVCKIFLDTLQNIGIKEGKVVNLIKSKLQTFLNDFIYIDWAIDNKDFLKSIGLFEDVKSSARKWVKDFKQFTQVAEKRGPLELSDEDKKVIAEEIPILIKKTSGLEFLDDGNVLYFLDKENKKKCFKNLKDVLGDKNEALEKRKQATDFLKKEKTLWSSIEKDDIYEFLKEVNKLKFKNEEDLKEKQKAVLDSWGFQNSSEEENK